MRATIYAGLFALTLGSPAWAASANGAWKTPSGAEVAVENCNGSLCGRLVSSPELIQNPALLDTANKDAALRARALKGMILLDGFHRSGSDWVGGTIYDPTSGSTYRSTVKILSDTSLKVSGCIIYPLCKTQTWTRLR